METLIDEARFGPLPEVTLDGERPFSLSNDDKEALQFRIPRQIPAVLWRRQIEQSLCHSENSNVSHEQNPKAAKTVSNGVSGSSSSKV